jgi:hypothetical protein
MLFFLIAMQGCALGARSHGKAAREAPVAGCYALEVGPWDARLSPPYHPDPEELPAAVQLDTTALTNWPHLPDARVARSLGEPGSKAHRFALWDTARGDSIHIGNPLPWAGFYIMARPEAGELRGRVTSFTDHIVEGRSSNVSAPAVLRRVSCSRFQEIV